MVNEYARKAGNSITDFVAKQLDKYFTGKRQFFARPLHLTDTDC